MEIRRFVAAIMQDVIIIHQVAKRQHPVQTDGWVDLHRRRRICIKHQRTEYKQSGRDGTHLRPRPQSFRGWYAPVLPQKRRRCHRAALDK